jgi:hypothetical protein
LRRLIKQRKVSKDVLATLDNVLTNEFAIPSDILQMLQANRKALENFQRYSSSYQRIRIAWIDGARDRPVEFQKRLTHFLRMTEKDKQYGFGIESYF